MELTATLDPSNRFVDASHQVELLGLCGRLNRDRGLTVVAVLHDLAQAARSSSRTGGAGGDDGRAVGHAHVTRG